MKCSLLVLSSYLDGELEARREGELEAHLVGCQRCRAGLGYLREEVDRVSALGRVHVADHSVHALLSQLGLIDGDEDMPEIHQHAAVALAEPPPAMPGWVGGDDAPSVPWEMGGAGAYEEDSVDMTGTPSRGALPMREAEPAGAEEMAPAGEFHDEFPAELAAEFAAAAAAETAVDAETIDADTPAGEEPAFRWVADPHTTPPAAAPDAQPSRPPFTWAPSPQAPAGAGEPAAAEEDGVPAVPFGFESGRPGAAAAAFPEPPPAAVHGPPAEAFSTPDPAPSAPPSGGAFPPGGHERVEPSDLLDHDSAPGGEPEMTASPPWAPHEAPAGPLYPLTDDDVLGEPMPVERFAPPAQAPRPSLFDRIRDRLAVRRALARSSSAYDDQVQIVSGMGAPLRPGRARAEVERRRQETLRMGAGEIPGEAVAPYAGHPVDDAGFDDELDADTDADLGLGPLPPLAEPLSEAPRMPRPTAGPPPLPPLPPLPSSSPHPGALPGQMPLPGTTVENPFSPTSTDPRAPIHRTPMPPARHTLGSVLGEPIPPSRPPLPPATPPATPPPPPRPDPLGEALSGYDREHGTVYEPRPWRPREIVEDASPAARPASPPGTAERPRRSPSQLRDGRRLLAVFGAATLVMFIVGVVSGKTTSPTSPSATSSNTTQHNAAPAPVKPKTSAPAAQSSSPAQTHLGPAAPALQAPAGTPQLTSLKTLGDGGTGWQVKDFRYGIHPNDFRIVLDLDSAGTPTGTSPKATLGFLDPTTLYVVLDGVVPAGSTGQLPSSNPVTGVTLLQPSPFPNAITYQIKLAHPVQFSAIYATSPLRLVLDLAG